MARGDVDESLTRKLSDCPTVRRSDFFGGQMIDGAIATIIMSTKARRRRFLSITERDHTRRRGMDGT